MTEVNFHDPKTFAETTSKVVRQISVILGNHVADAINPSKIYLALKTATAVQILQWSNEDTNLLMFRKLVNSISEQEDIGNRVVNVWKTSRLSRDAEYDWQAAGNELNNFINCYVGQDGHRYFEAIVALANMFVAMMYYCFADEHGFLPRRLIDGILDDIEDTVYENIENVNRWFKEHTVQ
jgi:hypothetical protein